MANKELLWDLSWRWYNADPEKRDKVPVDAVNGAEPLNHFEYWGDFYAYVQSQGYYFYYPYNLVGFDDGKYWDSTSENAELEYEKWYEWFNQSSSGGSGGSPGTDGDYYYYDLAVDAYFDGGYNAHIQDTRGKNYYFDLSKNVLAPETSVAKISKAQYDLLTEDADEVIIVVSGMNSYWGADVTIIGANSENITRNTSTTNGVEYLSQIVVSGRHMGVSASIQSNSISSGLAMVDLTGLSIQSRASKTYGFSAGFGKYVSSTNGGGGGESSSPVYPTYPPKETPDNPTFPTLPTIPGITTPDIGITSNLNDTTTTTVDLQPILDALRIINNNLIEVMTEISSFDEWLYTYLTNTWGILEGYIEYLGQLLEVLTNKMIAWFRTIDNDLSTIEKMLERIFWKHSGGGPSIDPVTQPDDSWNWWNALIQQLLNALPTAVVQFLQQLSRLNGVFPFSIPWDIGFLLGLFRQSPQTPIFDLAINSLYFRWSAHIDLSTWDTLALVVRRGELLAFAMTLITYTPAALKQLEVI